MAGTSPQGERTEPGLQAGCFFFIYPNEELMSTMNKEKLKGLQSFLKDDIWRVTEDEVSKSRGILYNAIKIATLSVREFTQGRILNKASALTYSTLLSIIPILAILFAIARVRLLQPAGNPVP